MSWFAELFSGMDNKDWIAIIAVILSPIIALQIQKWIEFKRAKKERKLYVFRTLMTTRATRVSVEHVRALNMIDVEFYNEKKVIDQWRIYHDHLTNGGGANNWWEVSTDMLINLLFEMGTSLGYKFDKVMLRRITYSPIAHGNIEEEEATIRQGLAKILSDKDSFNVFITNEPPAPVEGQNPNLE